MKHNPEKGHRAPVRRTLDCEAWEAMVADALDGTLEARDAEAFTAHSKECAGCGELLEEAQRGTEWLRFLRETPEAPDGLVEKILAGTSGTAEVQPLAAMGAVALPRQTFLGVPAGLLQRHMAESRILMTLAMAFFSLALTLNLTGVHLNQLKLSDLRPSTLASSVSHQYFTTSAHLVRYYSNVRFFYEVESRLNEIRRDDAPQQTIPVQQQRQPQSSQPQAQPSSQPSGKPGGSARNGAGHSSAAPRGGSVVRPVERDRYEPPTPVLAALPLPGAKDQAEMEDADFVIPHLVEMWGTQRDRSVGADGRTHPHLVEIPLSRSIGTDRVIPHLVEMWGTRRDRGVPSSSRKDTSFEVECSVVASPVVRFPGKCPKPIERSLV